MTLTESMLAAQGRSHTHPHEGKPGAIHERVRLAMLARLDVRCSLAEFDRLIAEHIRWAR